MLTYNQENYIGKAIESILFQKADFKFELLIIDDCSTDQTSIICNEYAQKYPNDISVIINPVNQGLLKNYLEIFDRSNGKYVAICEGDDYWIDELKLQKQVDFLETNGEYGLVHTKFDVFFEKDNLFKNRSDKTVLEGDVFEDLILNKIPIGSPTILFRRSLFIEVYDTFLNVLNEQGGLTIDLPLILALSEKSKIGFLPDYTAVYLRRATSLSSMDDFNKGMQFYLHCHNVRKYFAFSNQRSDLIEQLETNTSYSLYEISLLKGFQDKHKLRKKVLGLKPVTKRQMIMRLIATLPFLEPVMLSTVRFLYKRFRISMDL